MKSQLRHVGLVTNDIEHSIVFYSSLGFNTLSDQREEGKFISEILGKENASVRTVKMTNGNFSIELLDFGKETIPRSMELNSMGCTHIAVTVESAENAYLDLQKMKANFVSLPKMSDCGKVKVFFAKDPYNELYFEIVEELIK